MLPNDDARSPGMGSIPDARDTRLNAIDRPPATWPN
jgi:hypothetical protein